MIITYTFLPAYNKHLRDVNAEDTTVEFDAEELFVWLQKYIYRLASSLSPHKQLARQQQEDISLLVKTCTDLDTALNAGHTSPLALANVSCQSNSAWTVATEAIRQGLGVCTCALCQEVYTIAECMLDAVRFDHGGNDTILCPQGHELFYIYFAI